MWYLEFLYKTGQWIREEQKDISAQRCMKLLEMTEVLLNNIDPNKKSQVQMQLDAIAVRTEPYEL